MGKVNIKQLNVAPASGYVIGSGAGGVPVWKLEVTSVAWNQITGNQALVNLSGFTNDSGFITLGSLSAGTGISYNNLTGVITNSAPDQTVVLTQGTGITITGTYPNFTITNNSPASGIDLQDVLDNGNTAEQSITLTTGVDATMTFSNAGMLAQFGLKYVDFSAEYNYIDIGNNATSSGTRIYEPSGGGENAFLSTVQGANSTLRFLSGYAADADVTFRSITGTVALLGDNISLFTNNSGYITGAGGLAANSITDGLIRQSAGLSVIGRSANSTGNVADITAGTDAHVLRRSGASIGFGYLGLGSTLATNNQIVYGSGSILAQSSLLTFNGTTLRNGAGSTNSGAAFISRSLTNGAFSAVYESSSGAVIYGCLQDGNTSYNRVGLSARFGASYTGVFNIGAFGLGMLFQDGITTTADYGFTFGSLSAKSYTSGTGGQVTIHADFVPTSGTGIYNWLNISGGIGQTGGANGITRGLYLNHTLTAAADYRAIEVATGKTKLRDTEVQSTDAFYLGDPTTDGTWRIIRSGNDLLSQRRESGVYVTKQTITP